MFFRLQMYSQFADISVSWKRPQRLTSYTKMMEKSAEPDSTSLISYGKAQPANHQYADRFYPRRHRCERCQCSCGQPNGGNLSGKDLGHGANSQISTLRKVNGLRLGHEWAMDGPWTFRFLSATIRQVRAKRQRRRSFDFEKSMKL